MSMVKHPPGASNPTPGTAPPAVPTAPPAVIPATAGATTDLTADEWRTIETKIKAGREAYVPALAMLHEALHAIQSGAALRTTTASEPRKEAAALYSGILREYPNITATVSPDVIDAVLAVNAALAMVKNDFDQALPAVESSERRTAQVSWTDARMVRTAAKAVPNKDAVLIAKIASAEALLHQGKRVTVSANAAAKAQAAATKSQKRAAKAVAKAEKAAQVAARVAETHAANHPTTPDVVIVPAGSTTPTTPAVETPTGTLPKP